MSEPEQAERLNKYLAHAGLGSRRHVEELITAGRVSVDGRTVRELSTRVQFGQKVLVDGAPVKAEKPVYWMVNKPRGHLCTNNDPAGRPLVIELVPQVPQRVYTVGRLDEGSEGLVLLTNDGDLAHRLLHPRFGVEKTYLVQVAGSPSPNDLKQLLQGVWLSDGKVKAKRIKRLKGQGGSTWLRIVLNEGKNREIRRMLARLGHKVMKLRRIAFADIRLGSLAPGKARRLNGLEVEALRSAARRGLRELSEPEEVQVEDRPRANRPAHVPFRPRREDTDSTARLGREAAGAAPAQRANRSTRPTPGVKPQQHRRRHDRD